MIHKKYVYYNSKGKLVTGADWFFVLMIWVTFLLLPFIALFECIYLFIFRKGKYVTKREYYETKLKEIKNER